MVSKRVRHRATIHDVAVHAGVCAATVSKVLRGIGAVKPERILRVRAAVDALSYRPDPLAAGLRIRRRKIIAAIVPDLESEFFGILVTALEGRAEQNGYDLIVTCSRGSEPREAALVERMYDWRVAGTILVPVRSERGQGVERLRALRMSAVLVDRVSANEHFDTIAADNFEASARVADLIVAAGHRHVMIFGNSDGSRAIGLRIAGFVEQARRLDPFIRIETLMGGDDIGSQRSAVQDYLNQKPPAARPTAIYSVFQRGTLVVLSEIRRLGIRCPDEIALVGFDDAEWMQTTWPSITAVAQPVHAIADRAMAVLLSRIESGEQFATQHLETCSLTIRESLHRKEESMVCVLPPARRQAAAGTT